MVGRRSIGGAVLALVALASLAVVAHPRQESGESRAFHVVARKFAFSEPRLEVRQNDLVKITFETADIPHSFTIDEPYRIAKRAAAPGHPVIFEFRADKVGTFDFYCSLTIDDGCRKMKGQLVVTAR
jgi:cytochrome c oxidase subunit II